LKLLHPTPTGTRFSGPGENACLDQKERILRHVSQLPTPSYSFDLLLDEDILHGGLLDVGIGLRAWLGSVGFGLGGPLRPTGDD
jgi:hypothetical protein